MMLTIYVFGTLDPTECPQLIFAPVDEGSLLEFLRKKRHLDPEMMVSGMQSSLMSFVCLKT
jgi:hypothetical protein